jgi:hypothetical protein
VNFMETSIIHTLRLGRTVAIVESRGWWRRAAIGLFGPAPSAVRGIWIRCVLAALVGLILGCSSGDGIGPTGEPAAEVCAIACDDGTCILQLSEVVDSGESVSSVADSVRKYAYMSRVAWQFDDRDGARRYFHELLRYDPEHPAARCVLCETRGADVPVARTATECGDTLSVERVRLPGGVTPRSAMVDLMLAFGHKDESQYQSLLDEQYLFTEVDCDGKVLYENDKAEEMQILFGAPEGATVGAFDFFRSVDFRLIPSKFETELGAEPGSPDDHPGEDWEVIRGRGIMLLLEATDDGYRVEQPMVIKMRQSSDALWRLVRWIDDSPFRAGKRATAEQSTWGGIKAQFLPSIARD